MIPDDFPARIFQILEMAAMTDIPHFLPNVSGASGLTAPRGRSMK
jgi:hypothetical protein